MLGHATDSQFAVGLCKRNVMSDMSARPGMLAATLAAILSIAVLSPTSVASDDKQFSIYIDTDAPGHDYKQIDPPSLSYCLNRCGAEAACKAFTYNRTKQVCFLKYKSGFPLIRHMEAITGRKIADTQFSISKYQDAPGYDYDRVDPPSASECQRLCSSETECRAFSYNVTKRVCFLKYKEDVPRIRHNEAITGIKDEEAPPSNQQPTSSGTGFAISSDGLILTNQHVVEGCKIVTAEGWGTGVLKAVDPTNDLALVKFEISSSPVTFRSTPAEIGEDVFAIGYPYAGELGLNFTKGSVSSITGPENDSRLLQFTAPVQPGNSGGPLLDKSGLIVGIVRAVWMPAQNVNFAIHADLAASFLKRNDIDPIMAASSSEAPLPTEIAKRANLHTLRLTCLSGGEVSDEREEHEGEVTDDREE